MYAPGIQPVTPQVNLGNWGRALMHILGEKDAKAEQAKEEAKQFKTYVAMGEQLGLDKNELTTKDLATVKGHVEGHITQSNLKRAMEDSNVRNQAAYANILRDTQAINAGNQAQANQQAGLDAIPGFMADLNYQPDTMVERPLTQQQIVARAMERNPNIRHVPGNTMMSQMLERAVSAGNGGNSDFMPVPFDVNGIAGLVSPRTGAVHVKGGGAQAGMTFEQRVQLMDRAAALKEKGNLTKALPFLTGEMADAAKAQLAGVEARLAALGGAPAQSDGGTASPEDSDISYLKAHPELRGAFDERFGKGSSAKYVN